MVSGDKKAVRKVTVFDVQYTDCPENVAEEVKVLWRLEDLGNDYYVYKTTIEDLRDMADEIALDPGYYSVRMYRDGEHKMVQPQLGIIIDYLRSQGVDDDEKVWIHWWW